ncbi:MAG TPA: thiamine phosphate synthase [Kofleriaceae bacterium]|jgi:thiamine-phosphate pyrophosphorylase|nr:thiamine phosphate synthase [Kofleriaceae bacterium]
MSVRDAISGFYAVLDRDDEALARALVSTARVLQVRIKPRTGPCDAAELLRVARMARRVCDDAGAALIVNDRIDVALAADADGVHLGQTDLPIAEARRISRDLWIGISTHDLTQVRAACDAGADYLGFGPVFATTTKHQPDPVQGITGLRAAVAAASGRPIVAIGGITSPDVGDIYRTGVHAICAISSVNQSRDPRDAARQFRGPLPT